VNVKVPGGDLNVLWEGSANNVFLEGKVEHAFDGVYYI
jgi:diaminopimelate epimerase